MNWEQNSRARGTCINNDNANVIKSINRKDGVEFKTQQTEIKHRMTKNYNPGKNIWNKLQKSS